MKRKSLRYVHPWLVIMASICIAIITFSMALLEIKHNREFIKKFFSAKGNALIDEFIDENGDGINDTRSWAGSGRRGAGKGGGRQFRGGSGRRGSSTGNGYQWRHGK